MTILMLKCKNCNSEFIKNTDYKSGKYCSKLCYIKKSDLYGKLTDSERLSLIELKYHEKVIKSVDGCWGWSGPIDSKGYAYLQVKFKNIRAHRASWLIHKGELPDNLLVLHQCDNPICTNPTHLFLGTTKDNIRDMHKKNRQSGGSLKGSVNPKARLNEIQVLEIKKLLSNGDDYRLIAQRFNVNRSTIQNIKQQRNWTHVIIQKEHESYEERTMQGMPEKF